MVEVSIIVPCYHAERFVRKCIDSILSQSYSDYEVIFIVDDYLYDNTVDIIKSTDLWKNYRVIIVESSYKTSPAAARNKGISYSHGKYIAFLDVDDTWVYNKLELQILMFNLDPDVDIVYTRTLWKYTDGREVIHGMDCNVPWFNPHNIRWECAIPHSTIMIKKDSIRVKFDERLKAGDDYKWLLDLNDIGFKAMMIPIPLVNIGVHGENLTTGTLSGPKQVMAVHALRHEYLTGLIKAVVGLGVGLVRKR